MEIIYFSRVQIVSIISSLIFFIFVFEMIRREHIKVQYSLLWFFFSIFFIILASWRDAIEYISSFIGIAYSPTAFILILLMVIVCILIQYSMVISKMSERNKILTQELAILTMEFMQLKEDISKKKEI